MARLPITIRMTDYIPQALAHFIVPPISPTACPARRRTGCTDFVNSAMIWEPSMTVFSMTSNTHVGLFRMILAN